MKMNAYIAGVGMTRFGKHLELSLKSLAGEAIGEALADAGLEPGAVEAAYMANAAGGVVQGRMDAPLLLTRSASLPPMVADALAEQADSMSTVHYYGGPGAIAQGVRDQIGGIIQ